MVDEFVALWVEFQQAELYDLAIFKFCEQIFMRRI